MTWVIFPILAAFFFTLGNFTNNYIVDTALQRKKPEAIHGTWVICHSLILIGILAVFGVQVLAFDSFDQVLFMLLSGFITSIGAIPWFRALKGDDTFGVTVFGQTSPIIALILGFLFLNEQINSTQLIAFGLVFAAIFIVIFSAKKTKRSKINYKSALLITLACLIWVSADIIFMSAIDPSEPHTFAHGLAWFTIGAIIGILSAHLVFPDWSKILKKSIFNRPKYTMFLVSSNVSEAIGGVFIKIAIVLAPALSIAFITQRISQLFITFVLGIILSKLWPRFGREKLTRRAITAHFIALILAVAGIIILNF